MKTVIDHHTHIGHFYQTNYQHKSVLTALKKCNVSEITCAYLTPKFDTGKDAVQFYDTVPEEVKAANMFARKINVLVHFLAWLDPLVIKSGITPEKITNDFDYAGFALHPVLHDWTGSEAALRDDVFHFCKNDSFPIFIHTGVSSNDNPLNFEPWFQKFPEVPVRLAHCKEPDPLITLFSKYKNLTGDTAFCPRDSYAAICKAGLQDRMYFGSDFPITHWYEKMHNTPETVSEAELTVHYKKLLEEKKF